MEELYQLAKFVAETSYDRLPEEVIKRVKWVVRDTVGAIIGGMQEPEVSALAEYAGENHPGPCTLFGTHQTTSPPWAALVHGTAGTTLEMDEGHAFARGHAAVHALPPALGLAQAKGTNGREALLAFIVGYEVAARAGIASRLRKPVHPFGAWGVLGAAAIGARFHQGDKNDVAGTLEVAASYAIAPSFKTAYQGANVRNTYAGMVNQLGLLAADLYTIGFRGEAGGLSTTFGQILGQQFDPGALVDGLGERYEILRGYFKPYSSCRYTHAAVDAALEILAEGDVDLDEIKAIEVETYDIAANLADPLPKTPLAGRFSLPYVTAATLVTGGAGPEIFTPEMLTHPGLLSLSQKVRVRENPDYTALTPAKRPAQVRVYFTDGSAREKTVMGSKGDPDRPMADSELETKFHMLVDPVVGQVQAGQAWETIGHLEELSKMDELFTSLVPAQS